MTLNEQTTYKLKAYWALWGARSPQVLVLLIRDMAWQVTVIFLFFRLLDFIDHCAWHYHLCWLTHVLLYLTSQTRAKITNVSTQSMFNICVLVNKNNCWIKLWNVYIFHSAVPEWLSLELCVCVYIGGFRNAFLCMKCNCEEQIPLNYQRKSKVKK